MPWKPPSPCRHHGCGRLTLDGYCDRHAQAARRRADQARPSAAKRGYGHRWRKYCQSFLAKHPVCACGCGQPSTDVDHTKAINGPGDPLFWNKANHQALAHECHSRKTAREDGGGWRGGRKIEG